jgi:hypothetical protein
MSSGGPKRPPIGVGETLTPAIHIRETMALIEQ